MAFEGLLTCEIKINQYEVEIKNIFEKIGLILQMQDDITFCFGNPVESDKTGTDINFS